MISNQFFLLNDCFDFLFEMIVITQAITIYFTNQPTKLYSQSFQTLFPNHCTNVISLATIYGGY